jgi:2,4-dienoyl-CoA reductase-like NADH-dependent reductase (Old Yellow Enzyme family)
MATPHLFTPLRAGKLSLANRIVIAPMCQYSAVDGCMTDWHLIHLGHLALSGAALLTIEATAVVPEGRITYADVGLWSDDTEAAIARTLESVRRWSDIPIAIQLAHAGRKASHEIPWKGGRQLLPGEQNGWQTEAPSPLPFEADEHPPGALDRDGRARVREAFDAVRASFPADRSVSVRVSGTDWADGGWDDEQTVAFAKALEARGCAAIHVSSGGLTPEQKIPVGPGYQVPLARAVKAATSMPVVAVGLITDYDQADAIIASGEADMIALARGILYDPRWPWHAAAHLGAKVRAPKQYLRSQPRQFRELFDEGE